MEGGIAINHYNLVEDKLRYYLLDQVYLESLYNDLALLELEYSISGISYDGIGGSSGVSDMTSQTAMRLGHRRMELEIKIATAVKEQQHISRAIDNLNCKEMQIIQGYYFKGKQLASIAIEMYLSISQVKNHKREAMKKLIRQFYGE